MNSLLKSILYGICFSFIIYLGKDITWTKSVSIGACLGVFLSIFNDILAELKNKKQ